MAVDVVAEQRRRILGHHAQAAVRQQAGFDERLETVADAEDQPAAVEQRMDFIVYILIVKYVDDKLGAAVGFVARREAAAQYEDMGAADMFLHFADRTQDVVAPEVAQHAHFDLGPGLAECLGRVVVAVGAREHGDIDQRMFDGFAPIGESPGCGLRGHHPGMVLPLVGVNGREFLGIGLVEGVERHFHAVDGQRPFGCGHTQQPGRRMGQFDSALDKDRTIGVSEEFRLVHLHLGADAVAESHLGKTFGDTSEAHRPCGEDIAAFDIFADEAEVFLQLRRIGHMVLPGRMAHQVDTVAGLLEIGRNDRPGIHRRDAEGHQHGRDVDMLERARHRVLAADRGQAQFDLHLQRTEQGTQRLAPRAGIAGHAFEIFLV